MLFAACRSSVKSMKPMSALGEMKLDAVRYDALPEVVRDVH
jgi:hypothetical protein